VGIRAASTAPGACICARSKRYAQSSRHGATRPPCSGINVQGWLAARCIMRSLPAPATSRWLWLLLAGSPNFTFVQAARCRTLRLLAVFSWRLDARRSLRDYRLSSVELLNGLIPG
jgi:hypothetical protein